MTDFWFDRIAEYWEIPMQLDLAEHVRHARLQVVQTGRPRRLPGCAV